MTERKRGGLRRKCGCMIQVPCSCRAAADVRTPEPPGLHVPEAVEPERDRSIEWPEDVPMPTAWRRDYHPCPKCRRIIRVDEHGVKRQVVRCSSTKGTIAYLRCTACGHAWKMPRRSP